MRDPIHTAFIAAAPARSTEATAALSRALQLDPSLEAREDVKPCREAQGTSRIDSCLCPACRSTARLKLSLCLGLVCLLACVFFGHIRLRSSLAGFSRQQFHIVGYSKKRAPAICHGRRLSCVGDLFKSSGQGCFSPAARKPIPMRRSLAESGCRLWNYSRAPPFRTAILQIRRKCHSPHYNCAVAVFLRHSHRGVVPNCEYRYTY